MVGFITQRRTDAGVDQDIINRTVAGLTTADTHGILSVRGIDEFISVNFDDNKARNESDFIALPTSTFFLVDILNKNLTAQGLYL